MSVISRLVSMSSSVLKLGRIDGESDLMPFGLKSQVRTFVERRSFPLPYLLCMVAQHCLRSTI